MIIDKYISLLDKLGEYLKYIAIGIAIITAGVVFYFFNYGGPFSLNPDGEPFSLKLIGSFIVFWVIANILVWGVLVCWVHPGVALIMLLLTIIEAFIRFLIYQFKKMVKSMGNYCSKIIERPKNVCTYNIPENIQTNTDKPNKSIKMSSYNIKWIGAYIIYSILMWIGFKYSLVNAICGNEDYSYYEDVAFLIIIPLLTYLLFPVLLKKIGKWRIVRFFDNIIDIIYKSIKERC